MTTLEAILLAVVVALVIVSVVTYRKFITAHRLAESRRQVIKHHIEKYNKLKSLRERLSKRLATAEEKLRETPKVVKKRTFIQRSNKKQLTRRREKDAIRNEILKYMR